MNRAFTLVELVIVISMVVIILSISSYNIIKAHQYNIQIPIQNPIHQFNIVIGEDTYKFEKFKLEGHMYFMVNSKTIDGFTVVHNPRCIRCNPVIKEIEQ